ncbi:hypothetical protein CEE39_09060 [bacterium (candidate division B38) B3_B38]|nr:MAG: hypothetical protein CEE39_09060 [bacterium (candidate division B38) B3_B38]
MTEEATPKSYAIALKLLSIRARSQAEMEKMLEKRAFSEDEIATTIRVLKEKNYLNDLQFAYQYSLFGATNRLMGRHRLFQKLLEKGVAAEVIHNALDQLFNEINEEKLLEKAISKKVRMDGLPKTINDFKRLYDYIYRRGFPTELIWKKLAPYKKRLREVAF